MRLFASPSERQLDISLLFIRLGLGAVYAAHGGQKLFQYGLAGVAGGFEQMGLPMPQILGPLAAILEFFGGTALILGILSRPAAIAVGLSALGAAALVHGPAGFFLPAGYEFVMVLSAMALTIALCGGGRYSVDNLILARTRNTN